MKSAKNKRKLERRNATKGVTLTTEEWLQMLHDFEEREKQPYPITEFWEKWGKAYNTPRKDGGKQNE